MYLPDNKLRVTTNHAFDEHDHACLVKLLHDEYKDLLNVKYLFELLSCITITRTYQPYSHKNYLTEHHSLNLLLTKFKKKLNRIAYYA